MLAAETETSGASPDWQVESTPQEVAERVADFMLGLLAEPQDRYAVCLSGGSTPRLLYQLLAAPPARNRVPWDRVHWFWGDERFVPYDHPESNFGMAQTAMLSIARVPPDNVHPVPTVGLSPAAAALEYERTLKQFYGAEQLDADAPLFDLTLLGIGTDGHTASLFPGSPALAERQRWAIEVLHARPEPRISLTFPVLNSSRNVAFLAVGSAKREILGRVRSMDPALPAVHVRPVGRLIWFVDAAAAP